MSIRDKYHKANTSPRRDNIYGEVLLAAALSPADDLGYFAPADLKKLLAALLKRDEVPVSLVRSALKDAVRTSEGRF